MIIHTLGADTRINYSWTTSEGAVIVPTDATFIVTDTEGTEVLSWLLGDPGLTTGTYAIELHLDDALVIERGFYEYALRTNDGTDWHLISGGLLRVR